MECMQVTIRNVVASGHCSRKVIFKYMLIKMHKRKKEEDLVLLRLLPKFVVTTIRSGAL